MARHTGYVIPTGGTVPVPVVTELDHLQCLTTPPEFPHLRLVDYKATGEPVLAEGWECCDAICTDAEEAADACFVEADAWPLGPGPGIMRRVRAYVDYRSP